MTYTLPHCISTNPTLTLTVIAPPLRSPRLTLSLIYLHFSPFHSAPSHFYPLVIFLFSIFVLFPFLLAYFTYLHPSYPCAAPLQPLIISLSLYTSLNAHHHCHPRHPHLHHPLSL